MMFKAAFFLALLVFFAFASAETAVNAGTDNLELANKGIECAGHCGPQRHHRSVCCGCPRKGAVSKVKVLNDIFLEFLYRGNQKMENFVDMANFGAYIQASFGPNYCCGVTLGFPAFWDWFRGWFFQRVYTIYERGVEAYENHDGCVVVPFDMVGTPLIETKDAYMPSTPTFKVKAIWCPAEGCNWKVDRMEFQSYSCLNITASPCPGK